MNHYQFCVELLNNCVELQEISCNISEIKSTLREGGNELQATIDLSEKEKSELLKEYLAKFYMSRPIERNKALGGIRIH